eukprot:15108916-Heterocapsa_arctica.AAC.1
MSGFILRRGWIVRHALCKGHSTGCAVRKPFTFGLDSTACAVQGSLRRKMLGRACRRGRTAWPSFLRPPRQG